MMEVKNIFTNLQVEPEFDDGNKMFPLYVSKSVSTPYSLSTFPPPVREVLDELAAQILDPENRKNILVGHSNTGKTFILEQLAHNIDEYLKNSNLEKLIFISVTDVEMMELGTLPNVKKHINLLCKKYNAKRENLCFVVDSYEAGVYISMVEPNCRVLIEMDQNTYMAFYEKLGVKSLSKSWSSWKTIDVNDVQCTRKELSDLLWTTTIKRLNSNYTEKLTKRQVNSFINQAIKRYPTMETDDGEEDVLIVPPGIWATCFKHLFGLLNYHKPFKTMGVNGKSDFNKLVSKTLDDCSEYFSMFDEDNENFAIEEEIMRALSDIEPGRIVTIHRGSPVEEQKKVSPITFNDIPTLNVSLKKTIMGQDDAIDKVTNGLLIPATGLNDPTKPLKSFLFLGPTGVGKTQLALDLAKQVSTEPMNVVRIDMSEYQKSHEVSKLFGAPPGYAGFEQGGVLTSAVAANPHSVVLLDEIEKAHPKVWDSFLQVLDAGHMTDSQGTVVDFTQTIIIMTSNMGAREMNKSTLGFVTGTEDQRYTQRVKDSHNIVVKAVERELRPEMINRIDEMVVFNELDKNIAGSIIRREISIVSERLKTRGVTIAPPKDNIVELLLSKADISRYGAREIQRIVFKNVASKVAAFIVNNPNVKHLSLDIDNKEIVVVKHLLGRGKHV